MKRLVMVLALPILMAAGTAHAQRPATDHRQGVGVAVSPGELKATPEMWFYEQAMRQYKDPKAMVRARAEYKADQRTRRLESMKWFGFSNSRPRASSDPFNNDYAPHWVANQGYFPSRWAGMSGYY